MNILSIETSCDETAIAIVKSDGNNLKVLANIVSSQIKLHAEWGGVVPNLAAREHLKNIIPVLKEALETAKITPSDIDLIAVTEGPGLIPALLIGTNTAKTLAYKWKKSLLGIHHIEGHIYANFISENKISSISNSSNSLISKQFQNSNLKNSNIEFPILCLVVSGGHTQLILMKDHLQYEIIGQTLDDAAGEAFDKVARILNLGYPGGPAIAAAAANFQFSISNFQSNSNELISNEKSNHKNSELKNSKLNQNSKLKIKNSIKLPRPMLHSKDFNFSFSGLKTAVLYQIKKIKKSLDEKELQITDYKLLITEMAYEFQQAAIDVLVHKTIKAAQEHQPKTIMLAGGVSANKQLREQLGKAIKNNQSNLSDSSYLVPALSLTGDNAAMIAAAAAFRWQKMSDQEKQTALENWKTLETDANLKLEV